MSSSRRDGPIGSTGRISGAIRELLLILAWRDVSVRYKQTTVGIAWAFIRPFLTMVVFTVVFGHIAKVQNDSAVPYALVVIGGLLPWTLFAAVLGDASNSVISNSNLISKVYFPRMIVPLATVLIAVIDFCVSLSILAGLMIWYGLVPGWQILLLPAVRALALLASLGPAIWAAAIVVKYRDFRFVVPFALQFGLYVSPVGFPSSVVPEQLAAALQPQSDGRHHRRLPLVHRRRRQPDLLAGLPAQPRRHGVLPVAGYPHLPAHRARLCGHDLR